MAEQVHFEDVDEGQEIPKLVKNCSPQQLVLWAAGSGDFYQIHYDKDFAISTGLKGIIVHGALKNAFLGQLLDLTLFADLREVPGAMDFLRAAFIEESGCALISLR